MDETAVNRRFWTVVIVFAVLIAGAGVWGFFNYQTYTALKEEIASKTVTRNEKAGAVAAIKVKEQKLEMNRAKAAMYEKFLPSEDDIPGMFKKMSELAVNSGMYVNAAAVTVPTTSASQQRAKEMYETRIFNFSLIGTYPSIVKFINEVERMDRFAMVNQVKLTPAQETRMPAKDKWVDPTAPVPLSCQILIYAFVFTGGGK